MTKRKPPEEIAPENAGENTPDGEKKKYSVVLKGRDNNGIMYEQALETPFEVEVLTPESLAYLQEQAEYIPGGFAGAWRIMEARTREQKPTTKRDEQETFFETIAPYFECGMIAYMVMSANRHKELDFIMENFGNSGERIFALYGKRPAFIKKELKKAFYEGRTIEELEDEYINMFLALPFEEQQKALDEKEIYLFPGTKYAKFIKAWQEFILKDGGESAFKLREPENLRISFDRVTSEVSNQKNPKQAAEIAGSVFVESRREREAGKKLETTYIIKKDDEKVSLSLNKKDLLFIMFIDGIYRQALIDGVPKDDVKLTPYELAKIVFQVDRPGTHYIDDVKEMTKRLRRISVCINNEQEAKERGKVEFNEEFYLLPCEITKEGMIHILKRPVLFVEWIEKVMKEFTTVSPKVLCVPSVSMTDDTCAIRLELLRSILGNFTRVDKVTKEKVIPFSLLFENCGISDKDQKTRSKKTIEKCLVWWSGEEFRKTKDEYKTFLTLPEPLRIIDGFRIDRKNIYIKPIAKTLTEKKK